MGLARAAASREARPEAWLVYAMLGALGLFPLVPYRAAWIPITIAVSGLCWLSARRHAQPALHLGSFCAALLLVLSAFGSMKYWPLPPALAVLAYLVAVRRVPALGGVPRWLTRGRLDFGTLLLMGAAVIVSATALVLWFSFTKPDYRELVHALFPHLPVPILFLGVIGFSAINAAIEEFIYRGVLLSALEASAGSAILPWLLQALVFGIVHIAGFPRGLVGVGLATIYGLMMGAVRRRAGGMLAPWLAHIATDVAIGSILLSLI